MPTWPSIQAVELRHPHRPAGRVEVVQAPQRARYTLVVPFSRPWAWPRWLACFCGVWLPEQTELLALVDHDDQAFYDQVTEGMRTLLASNPALCGARVVWTRREPLDEWSDLAARRRRIAGNWGTFLAQALGEVILGAEDDTLPDAGAYRTLLEHLDAGAVFAQGTCIGRWDAGIVPHWKVYEDERGPLAWATGSYSGTDVVEIEGGGWYCFAARTTALRLVDFGRATEPIGPDVWACYQLSRLGRCVGDWRVQCLHVAETMDLSPNREVVDQVTFRFLEGRWRASTSAGRGRVDRSRPVQLAGSQPRPHFSPGVPVRTIRLFGNAPPEVKEFSAR